MFGVMMTVRELCDALESDNYREIVGGLWRAIEEPHGATANEDVRTWYRYVP